eukprot:1145861-Pelagomonas_calceolata.AAC.2
MHQTAQLMPTAVAPALWSHCGCWEIARGQQERLKCGMLGTSVHATPRINCESQTVTAMGSNARLH